MRRVLGVLLSLWLAGCVHVAPWQRGVLADPRMQPDPSPGRAAARRHVLSVREGTEGASRAAGAACGCN